VLPATAACRFCRHALDAQAAAAAAGRTHFERSACRAEALADVQAQHRRKVGQRAQAAAAGLTGFRGPPVLLQLQAVPQALVPLAQDDRDFLAARWQQAWDHQLQLHAEGDDSDDTLPAQANALCAHCGGGCCAKGGQQAAFVDHSLLLAWLAGHPGQTLQDAFADYLGHLPAQHVAGQCCYQSATGCALPRKLRAATCNRYRCEALDTLGTHLAEDPQASAVVLTWDGGQLQSAGSFQGGRFTPLDGLVEP
jgi:hypothetical protein